MSDGGRVLDELKKRVGDLSPYRENIANILEAYGTVTLESGRILTVRNFQTCVFEGNEYKDYLGGLNRFIRVISLISVADKVKVHEYGAVSVC